MGLDNGIMIKAKKDFVWKSKLGNASVYEYQFMKDDTLEVCYWRKCWGIRNDIIQRLHMVSNECNNEELESADIRAIVRILEFYTDKEYWEKYADSIWEYKEIIETLWSQIYTLVYVESLVNDGLVEVSFYDSW